MDSTTSSLSAIDTNSQLASLEAVGQTDTSDLPVAEKLRDGFNANGTLMKLVIDDVTTGEGKAVVAGDLITVHYIGTLQNGQQFDNSYTKGQPFSFTVGEGKVIKGWDEGVLGMKTGGQRVLIIPPTLAYGENPVGPIPPNSTLVFSVELVSIN
jgi:FKBP-type peptidyl-prolyl cis-trans isomerase